VLRHDTERKQRIALDSVRSMTVRPLDVEPEPTRRGPILIAAALLALGGFAIYLTSGPTPLSAPTTTEAVTTTTTTTPPPTTTTPPATLRDRVPGFQGRVRGVLTTEEGTFGWTWSSGEATARVAPLPANAVGSWDTGLGRIAVTAASSFGRSLYYGSATDVREVHNGVESFAWHDTDPDLLAWLSGPQPDGLRELWRSLSGGPQGSFSASLVARLDLDAHLVGYGDWGYAFEVISPSQDRPRQLATYDPDGGLIAQASGAYADSTGAGRLLVITGSEGDAPQLAIAGPNLGARQPIGPAGTPGGVFSPNGEWVAAVTIDTAGADLLLLSIAEAAEEELIPLGIEFGDVVAWSGDGRWVLIDAGRNEPAVPTASLLLFVDTGSSRVYPVDVDGLVSGLGIHSTATPGPSRYFVP
jgi:hypothetical protein